jgi:hypothetical protein
MLVGAKGVSWMQGIKNSFVTERKVLTPRWGVPFDTQ